MTSDDNQQTDSSSSSSSSSSSFTLPSLSSLSWDSLYQTISFRDYITHHRLQVTNFINNNGLGSPVNIISALTTHPMMAKELTEQKLYDFSDKFNKENPLLGSICRSHEGSVITTSTVFVCIPALRYLPRRFSFVTIGLTAVSTKAAMFAVNYKWIEEEKERLEAEK